MINIRMLTYIRTYVRIHVHICSYVRAYIHNINHIVLSQDVLSIDKQIILATYAMHELSFAEFCSSCLFEVVDCHVTKTVYVCTYIF